MFKTADGITMHNDARCIGCRRCQKACPYSAADVVKEKAAYSVISANDPKEAPHAAYRDATGDDQGVHRFRRRDRKNGRGDSPPARTSTITPTI